MNMLQYCMPGSNPKKKKTLLGVRVRFSQFREIHISYKLLSVFTTVRAVKEHMLSASTGKGSLLQLQYIGCYILLVRYDVCNTLISPQNAISEFVQNFFSSVSIKLPLPFSPTSTQYTSLFGYQ